jgi:hypothetical protein
VDLADCEGFVFGCDIHGHGSSPCSETHSRKNGGKKQVAEDGQKMGNCPEMVQ